MNLGALFPNLGEPAAPTAAYPAAGGNGFGGLWIWILVILIFFFLFKRTGFGGLSAIRPSYGAPPGYGGGSFFGGF